MVRWWWCWGWGWDGFGETEGWDEAVVEDGIGEVPDEAAGEHREGRIKEEMRMELGFESDLRSKFDRKTPGASMPPYLLPRGGLFSSSPFS